ncbi:MAG: hypothetical protein ABH858_02545 [Candidatus Omnitrophota bacterium]
MKGKNKKSQAALEYLLFLTAFILVLIASLSSEGGAENVSLKSGLQSYVDGLGQCVAGIIK